MRYRNTIFALLSVIFMVVVGFNSMVQEAVAEVTGDAPPPSSDWLIDQPTRVANQSIAFNGNVIISPPNGSLVLENALLVIGDAPNATGPSRLLVLEGASLVANASTIRSADGTTFRFESLGAVSLNQTTLAGMTGDATTLTGGLSSLAGELEIVRSRIENSTVGITVGDGEMTGLIELLREFLTDRGRECRGGGHGEDDDDRGRGHGRGHADSEMNRTLAKLVKALCELRKELGSFLHHADSTKKAIADAKRLLAAEEGVSAAADMEGLLPEVRAVIDQTPKKEARLAKDLLKAWEALVADLPGADAALKLIDSLETLVSDAEAAEAADLPTLLLMLPTLAGDAAAFDDGRHEPGFVELKALMNDARKIGALHNFNGAAQQLIQTLQNKGFGRVAEVQAGVDALRQVRTEARATNGISSIHGKLSALADAAEDLIEELEEALDAARDAGGEAGVSRGIVEIDGLTITGGAVGAVFAAAPDLLSGLIVDNPATGIVALDLGTSQMMTMIDSSISASGFDFDVRGSRVLTVDSFYQRASSRVVGDQGSLTSNQSVRVTVVDETGAPFDGASVELRDVDSNLVAGGFSGPDGRVPRFEGSQYTLFADSLDFRDPHQVSAAAAGHNRSAVSLSLDSPKNLVIRLGGDTDGDGVGDGREDDANATWLEAESYRYSDSQIASDQTADLFGAPRTVLRNDAQGRIVNGESLPCVEPGTYRLYFRAKQKPAEPEARIVVNVHSNGFHAIVDDSRPVGASYAWYSTPTFISRRCEIKATIDTEAPQGVEVLVDELMLMRIADVDGVPSSVLPGSMTNPIAPDTDRDNLIDGLENKAKGMWFQAEELLPASRRDDRTGSNGLSARVTGGGFVDLLTENLAAGKYRVALKARADGNQSGLALEVRNASTNALLSLTTTSLGRLHAWVELPEFTLISSGAVRLSAQQSGASAVLIDEVSVLEKSDTIVDRTADGSVTKVVDLTPGGEQSVPFKLPPAGVMTEFTFSIETQVSSFAVPVPPSTVISDPIATGERILFVAQNATTYSVGSFDPNSGALSLLFPSASPIRNLSAAGGVAVWEQDVSGLPALMGANIGPDGRLPFPGAGILSPEFAGVSRQKHPYVDEASIVWQDDRFGSGVFDIFLLDLATGLERQITSDPFDNTDPAVSGTVVVWSDDRGMNTARDIRMFDLSLTAGVFSGARDVVIGNTTNNDLTPAVEGSRVAWMEATGPSSAVLHLRDISGGTQTVVALVNTTGSPHPPVLSEGKLLWVDRTANGDDVRAIRLSTGETFSVAQTPAAETNPSLEGNTITWATGSSGISFLRRSVSMDIGADGSQEWSDQEPLSAKVSVADLAEALGAVPVAPNGTVAANVSALPGTIVTISAIRMINGSLTSPLQGGDTDSDGRVQ